MSQQKEHVIHTPRPCRKQLVKREQDLNVPTPTPTPPSLWPCRCAAGKNGFHSKKKFGGKFLWLSSSPMGIGIVAILNELFETSLCSSSRNCWRGLLSADWTLRGNRRLPGRHSDIHQNSSEEGKFKQHVHHDKHQWKVKWVIQSTSNYIYNPLDFHESWCVKVCCIHLFRCQSWIFWQKFLF